MDVTDISIYIATYLYILYTLIFVKLKLLGTLAAVNAETKTRQEESKQGAK